MKRTVAVGLVVAWLIYGFAAGYLLMSLGVVGMNDYGVVVIVNWGRLAAFGITVCGAGVLGVFVAHGRATA